MAERRGRGGAPVVVRIAGLPMEAVERLRTGLCDAVDACGALRARADQARQALADRLHAEVPGAEPELRRFLLAVRRDCHNGRALARHVDDARWAALRERAGAAADDAARLDAAAADARAGLEARIAAERLRAGQALRETMDDAAFMRGVALASPELADALRALRGVEPAAYGRRERKAELALLRYVTRAATKVSPYSTLTPVALGTVSRDPALRGLELAGRPWRARSLVRAKRFLLHRVLHLLFLHRPFRDRLRVELNDSLAETEPGRFRYLRPHHWAMDAERGVLRYHRDALAAIGLAPALVARLAAHTAEKPPFGAPFGALVAAMADGSGGAEAARRQVDRLFDLGILQPVLPWPAHEGHLEARMLAELRGMTDDEALRPLAACFAELVALQTGFADAPEPARAVRALEAAVDAVTAAAVELAGLPQTVVSPGRPGASRIYEDVYLRPAGEPEERRTRGIARVPRAAMDEALRNARLVIRLSVLMDLRHDFRLTLAEVARERWPEGEAGVLEVLREVQPMWQEYLAVHLARWREKGGAATGWNPRGLPALDELHGWRRHVDARLAECGRMEDGEWRMDPQRLRALLDEVPARWTDDAEWGALMMLQPGRADGSLWMLNRLREGTGRIGSRYTPAMTPADRAAYTAHLAARGVMRVDGEPAALLDVQCIAGDTINVHAPQTPAVLAMPDDETDVGEGRRVRLRDLRIVFDGADGLPRVRDRAGRRLLPANLGLAFEAYLPTLLKFLCLFGPSEVGTVMPPRPSEEADGVTTQPRTVLGSLVLHRRVWEVPAGTLRALLEGSEAEAFAAVNRFRSARGIPERVFFADALPHDFFGKAYKPQYLDFSSPLLVSLLRGVAADGEPLRLTEMLPAPDALPRDEAGRAWAAEILVDSLALRRPRLRADAVDERALRARTRSARAGGLPIPH
jgi:Lantibiotic dehydratase, N terminus